MMQYAQIVTAIGQLLNMKFVPNSADQNSAIGIYIGRIIKLLNCGEHSQAIAELKRLKFLAHHLHIIKNYDEKLFTSFKNKLHHEKNNIDAGTDQPLHSIFDSHSFRSSRCGRGCC